MTIQSIAGERARRDIVDKRISVFVVVASLLAIVRAVPPLGVLLVPLAERSPHRLLLFQSRPVTDPTAQYIIALYGTSPTLSDRIA